MRIGSKNRYYVLKRHYKLSEEKILKTLCTNIKGRFTTTFILVKFEIVLFSNRKNRGSPEGNRGSPENTRCKEGQVYKFNVRLQSIGQFVLRFLLLVCTAVVQINMCLLSHSL